MQIPNIHSVFNDAFDVYERLNVKYNLILTFYSLARHI